MMLMPTVFAALLSRAASFSAPTRVISGLRDLVDDYDVFLLDQFGVLHNGGALLPGVASALETLAARGKRLVVLSNTSGRRHVVERKLPAQGFDAAWLAGVVTSGELAHRELSSVRWRAKRALVLGWDRGSPEDDTFLDDTGAALAGGFDDAELIVAQGPDTIVTGAARALTGARESGDLAPYLDGLAGCAARGVPMLVCNSDLVALSPDGRRWTMPGAFAKRYESLGGPTIHFGKPRTAPFELAVELAAGGASAAGGVSAAGRAARVCHVGDSVEHDVAGAHAAGVASVFVVETGIHRADAESAGWVLPGGGVGGAAAAAAVASGAGVPAPTYALAKFAW